MPINPTNVNSFTFGIAHAFALRRFSSALRASSWAGRGVTGARASSQGERQRTPVKGKQRAPTDARHLMFDCSREYIVLLPLSRGLLRDRARARQVGR